MPDAIRQLAVQVLARFERGAQKRLKADVLIEQHVRKHKTPLSDQDRAFLQALVMGTLRQWLRLGTEIEVLSKRDLKRINPQARTLLRIGLFQLRFLEGVPDYAAIDTTVELAKAEKLNAATVRFVNAILRAAQRQAEPVTPALDPEEMIAQKHSLPAWWVKHLLPHYGEDAMRAMGEAYQGRAHLCLRVNMLKTTVEAYRDVLEQAGIAWIQPDPDLPEVLCLPEYHGSPRQLPGYGEGWCYIQDPASAWVTLEVDPQPGERVLDMCAAPGSKTTHLAARMQNMGEVTAVESRPERLKQLSENLDRLGVLNVTPLQADGRLLRVDDFYDRVLVDAP